MTDQNNLFDVAIIGYGPVGATLAGLLEKQGLKVLIIEKNKDIYPKPRAVGFDHDAMRIFQQMGCAELLKPALSDFKSTHYQGTQGQVIQKILTMSPPYPLTWEPHFNCDQPQMESILRANNAQKPNITIHLNHELTQLKVTNHGVDITALDGNSNEQHFQCKYVVGCDGASSPVRKFMDSSLKSFDYDQHWIVVDMLIHEEVLKTLPLTNIQFCEPSRPSTYIVCPKNHRRWEFMSLDQDPKDELLSESFIWQLLSRWLEPTQAKIWRSASYRFHALVAEHWWQERVLICGDAAHQTPPFMGQGMCQGIRDAGNLAWKLAGVIKGQFKPAILESYEQERSPHVGETTMLAKKLGEILTVKDPLAAQERDQRLLQQGNGKPIEMVRQNLIPPLRHGIFDFESRNSGEVFPQPRVIDATGREFLLDDIAPFQFKVVMLYNEWSPSLMEVFEPLGIKIVLLSLDRSELLPTQHHESWTLVAEMNPAISRFFSQHQLRGALVRPDHYIFGGFKDVKSAEQVASVFEDWIESNSF